MTKLYVTVNTDAIKTTHTARGHHYRTCDLCKRGSVQGYGVPIHFTKTGATLHLLCAIYAAQKAHLN